MTDPTVDQGIGAFSGPRSRGAAPVRRRNRFGAAVLDALAPVACALCGESTGVVCARCSRAVLSGPSDPVPAWVDGMVVACLYDGAVRDLVARIKYRNQRAAAAWFTNRIAASIAEAPWSRRVDAVTWATATVSHRRSRGFDHARLLATRVGYACGVPTIDVLTRLDDHALTGRTREACERFAPKFMVPARRVSRVAGAGILVVDDVVTTGTTMSAAARVLRHAGVSAVFGAVAARKR